jgi:hypothetical protein
VVAQQVLHPSGGCLAHEPERERDGRVVLVAAVDQVAVEHEHVVVVGPVEQVVVVGSDDRVELVGLTDCEEGAPGVREVAVDVANRDDRGGSRVRIRERGDPWKGGARLRRRPHTHRSVVCGRQNGVGPTLPESGACRWPERVRRDSVI